MIVSERNFRSLLLICGLSFALVGCGSISLVKPTPAADIYDLSILSVDTDDIAAVDWQLVVEEPLAARALNTDRIMIKTSPHVVQYVANARWSERSPDLVHTHIVKAFEDSGKILSVGREVSGLRRDFELKSEIRKFQIETFGKDPKVSVEISFKLVEYPSAKVIDAQVFTSQVSVKSVRMAKVISGFDQAIEEVLVDVVHWVFAQGQGEAGVRENAPVEIAAPEVSAEVTDGTAEE